MDSCLVAYSWRFSNESILACRNLPVVVWSGFGSSSWSHQTQSTTLSSRIFSSSFDVPGCPAFTCNLWHFRLSYWIHFSSPAMIRCRNDFFLYRPSNILDLQNRHSISFGFSSYRTPFPCLRIFPVGFSRFEIACCEPFLRFTQILVE